VSIQFEAGGVPVVVEGDRQRLVQLVQNLVGNAVKYSPAGAPVRVAVARNGTEARITVADEGIGIRPEDLPRLFQKFSRLENARKSGAPGTGLGLYICRSIVEAHGGRIWAESEPQKGSTFVVTLPLPEGQASSPA
jgi:signal transduction histidine kinase